MIIEINPYDQKSINEAIKKVNQYKRWVNQKETQLLKKLSKYGATRVKVYYSEAQYDGEFEISVDSTVTKTTATIYARGSEVAFIEFGAGVYYNGAESYPLPRPDGIVGIGKYGKGRGKRKAWGYYAEEGNKDSLVITHGNPPAKALYKGMLDICDIALVTAKEVFKS